MNANVFWKRFDVQAAPKLLLREVSFRKIFQYLDTLPDPITIVETGCARVADNWGGDGQSTRLFDWYAMSRGEDSIVHTVDLSQEATDACKKMVSNKVVVHTGDSVPVLPVIAAQLKATGRKLDLLYLDSYDLDWNNPNPAAIHHLKELVSIISAINNKTLVVVDDCSMIYRAVSNGSGELTLLSNPVVGGKGAFIAEYASQVQAQPLFSHYQVGWTGMVAEG